MSDGIFDYFFSWQKNKRLLIVGDHESSPTEVSAANPYVPNHLLSNKFKEARLIASMGGTPTVADLGGTANDDSALAAIRKQVSEHGTQKEIAIDYVSHQFEFFKSLIKFQQETGVKVADRIVLDGGGRAASLSPSSVAYFKSLAYTLGTDIVSSASDVYAGPDGPMHGHFVKFTSTGGVERDRLYDDSLTKIEEQYYKANPSQRPQLPEASPGGVPVREAWFAGEQAPEDHKKFLFLLFDRTDLLEVDSRGINKSGDYSPAFEGSAVTSMGGHPTMYYMNSVKQGPYDYRAVINTLREHVKKYGTQKEVWVEGHGTTNHMGLTTDFDTEQFLRDVKSLEKELHVKIADRFVFGGCRVFANLSPHDQAIYQSMSDDLKAEIVASTTLTSQKVKPFDPSHLGADEPASGHFVEFTPHDVVKKDRLYDAQWRPDNYYKTSDPKSGGTYDLAADEKWFSELKPDPTPQAPKRKRLRSGPDK